VSILDPQLKVSHLQFYIKGRDSNSQASVIVVMEVFTMIKGKDYFFNLQTAVTPRYLGVEVLED
jgi:hypothetical protein